MILADATYGILGKDRRFRVGLGASVDIDELLLATADRVIREVVSLLFARPRGFEDLSAKAFADLVIERIRAAEDAAAAEHHRTGTPILGRRAVLDQRWSDRPGSREPRRRLNPRVAARSKWSHFEALMRNRAFRDAYAAARASFAAGLRDVIFPAGTY